MRKVTPIRKTGNKSSNSAENQTAVEPTEADELQQVRELLFGQQSREQERHTEQLERNVDRKLGSLESAVDTKFKRIGVETSRINRALSKAAELRSAENVELQQAIQTNHQLIDELSAKLENEKAELNRLISAEAARAAERHRELELSNDKQFDEIRSAMASKTTSEREHLANMLRTMANELVRGSD